MKKLKQEFLEDPTAVCLAAAGAAEGVFNYYLKPELTAKRGWLAIAGLVTVYELTCPEGELLSEGVDRALERHPVAVPLAIGITALHLLNILPDKVDPFHRFTEYIKGPR